MRQLEAHQRAMHCGARQLWFTTLDQPPPQFHERSVVRRRSLTQRSTCSESSATQTASSGRNLMVLLHVAVGGCCCLLRTAPLLTRAQVGRVPVPPVMLSVRPLVLAVMLFRLVEQLCKGCDV